VAAAIVAAADRSADDRAIDGQRKPAELLVFLDLKPGMRVAELIAGFGYTSELLVREPLPPEAKDLDAVVMVLFDHDTVWMKVDRARMNKAIFAALRPGGSFVIIDHSGRPGTGVTESQTLHRFAGG